MLAKRCLFDQCRSNQINTQSSLADSVIAVITPHHNAILLHKDPEYEQLQGVVEMEILPYKNSRTMPKLSLNPILQGNCAEILNPHFH